jgi:hypothetical protein
MRPIYLVLLWSRTGQPFYTWMHDPALLGHAACHVYGPAQQQGYGIDKLAATLRQIARGRGFDLDDPASWPPPPPPPERTQL